MKEVEPCDMKAPIAGGRPQMPPISVPDLLADAALARVAGFASDSDAYHRMGTCPGGSCLPLPNTRVDRRSSFSGTDGEFAVCRHISWVERAR